MPIATSSQCLADSSSPIVIWVNTRVSGSKPDALRATGLDPETRVLTQITIGDEESAKHWLDVAMGKDVTPRKKWIEDNPIDYVED